MNQDEYLDYIDELRRYHQTLSFEITPSEWARIAPEAVKDVSMMLLDRYGELEKVKNEIKVGLIDVEGKDENIKLVREVLIEMTLAKRAVRIENEISWLKRYLANFIDEKDKPEIGDEQIEMAKSVPLESLIPDLKYNSGRLIRRCPFHEEKTPSFYVFKNNSYYCFGCGEHGDSISYIMKTQNLGFIQAIKYLLKL